MTTLSTIKALTKKDLIDNLVGIPDNAKCTLQFKNGKFYLFFYWSDGACVIGHKAVVFDVESKELVEDAWGYMEKD